MCELALSASQVAGLTRTIQVSLVRQAERNRRWKAMTPQERAEAEERAIARMPARYREWYLATFHPERKGKP